MFEVLAYQHAIKLAGSARILPSKLNERALTLPPG